MVSEGSLAVTTVFEESSAAEEAVELSAEEASELSDELELSAAEEDAELSDAELEPASLELELLQPVKTHTLSARAASIAENFFIISFFLSIVFFLITVLAAYSS